MLFRELIDFVAYWHSRLSFYSWKIAAALRDGQKLNSLPQIDESMTQNKRSGVEFSLPPRTLTSLFDRNPQAWNKHYNSWRSLKNPLLVWLGLQVLLTQYGNSLHTTYFLSGKFGLWERLGARAVHFNLGLRVFPLTHLGFTILGGGLSVKRIVPETSELMMACQRGDVSTVRELFASQRASPYDVTASNCGPLRVSSEAVQDWAINGHRLT